jgi:uncharacterized membrane protein YccC
MASTGDLSPTLAFWRTITRLDRSKFNSNWMALRNAIATAAPLAVGVAIGHATGAVAVTTGALNVSYSDGIDPYPQRARRMLTWSVLGALAVFTGSVTGSVAWASLLVTAIWAFIAGMVLSISSRAGDLGLNTLVALIVFGARGALSPEGALIASALVLSGGLLQTGFALLFWPGQRHRPESRAIGCAYLKLAQELDPDSGPQAASPLTAEPVTQFQDIITALGREHSLESERYQLLFDQIDRIRMSVYVLQRLKTELRHFGLRQTESPGDDPAFVDRALKKSSELLTLIGQSLLSETPMPEQLQPLMELNAMAEEAQQFRKEGANTLGSDLAAAMDALAGQLRAVTSLATHATPDGLEKFVGQEYSLSWRLQVRSWIGTLRANLFPGSSAFRHALRLAVCVPLAELISRSISWQRSYWIPMTVAIVLKPDFTTTFSRGVLRLAGTFLGLALATLLYHIIPPSPFRELFLVGVFTFVLRRFGPANYGIFSIAISGLIVFLLAAIGVSPREAVWLRALNTGIGGLFALVAYALWPTWERTQIAETIADLIDASRDYFHEVMENFGRTEQIAENLLDEKRRAWRRARSNLEAAVDRVAAEPGIQPHQIQLLTSILASADAAAHAMLGLEAGLVQGSINARPLELDQFAKDVEFTLYFLSQALRGSSVAAAALPKLREDYRRMQNARAALGPQSEFVLMETDRLTVALNTLEEQVVRYLNEQATKTETA